MLSSERTVNMVAWKIPQQIRDDVAMAANGENDGKTERSSKVVAGGLSSTEVGDAIGNVDGRRLWPEEQVAAKGDWCGGSEKEKNRRMAEMAVARQWWNATLIFNEEDDRVFF